jgi:hypothetical protein
VLGDSRRPRLVFLLLAAHLARNPPSPHFLRLHDFGEVKDDENSSGVAIGHLSARARNPRRYVSIASPVVVIAVAVRALSGTARVIVRDLHGFVGSVMPKNVTPRRPL